MKMVHIMGAEETQRKTKISQQGTDGPALPAAWTPVTPTWMIWTQILTFPKQVTSLGPLPPAVKQQWQPLLGLLGEFSELC